MALAEDLLGENLGLAVVAGAAAFVLPAVAPGLSPPLRSALRTGLSLFMEAESEAEGNIIKGLAEEAVHRALEALSGPGTPEQRQEAARAAVRHYSQHARRRADRYGSDRQDRHARYQRHVDGLHRAVARKKWAGANPHSMQELERIIGGL